MKAVLYEPENMHLLIRIKSKKKYLDEMISEVYKTIAPTHKEEGCLEYRVFHKEQEIVIFGTWKNLMLLDMHQLLQFHVYLVEDVLPKMSKKFSLQVYKELEPPITALSIG